MEDQRTTPPSEDTSEQDERERDAETAERFRDPDWDDEYCTWLDNGLRTCCG